MAQIRKTAACPLCLRDDTEAFQTELAPRWQYQLCLGCSLVFRVREELPSLEEERIRYSQHNNLPDNEGYVRFLTPVLEKVVEYVPKGACGLDYGCGPGPVLLQMLAGKGFRVQGWDPIFCRETLPEPGSLDFVTCTEAAEHFHFPQKEFMQMAQLLKPGGILVLLTQMYQDIEKFSGWYYRKDPTHVSFYHARTYSYICEKFGFHLRSAAAANLSVLARNNWPLAVDKLNCL
jgi:SAM-dependent methyltransferase